MVTFAERFLLFVIFCSWVTVIADSEPFFTSDDSVHTKVYAVYLPQYQPDTMADRESGKEGFTDWATLRERASSNLASPTELGYYDLLDGDIRRKQAELAREYGIDGFIYNHYWFYRHEAALEGRGGDSIFAGSLEKMLSDDAPNIQFALNWVYEDSLLDGVQQVHQNLPRREGTLSAGEQIRKHYDFLKRFFHHKNYIMIHGVPLFSVSCFPLVDGGTEQQGNISSSGKSTSKSAYADTEIDSISSPTDIIRLLRKFAMDDGFPSPGLHIPLSLSMQEHSLYSGAFPPPRIRPTVEASFQAITYAPPFTHGYASAASATLKGDSSLSAVYTSTAVTDSLVAPNGSSTPASAAVQRQMELPPLCRAQVRTSLSLPSYIGVTTSYDNTARLSQHDQHQKEQFTQQQRRWKIKRRRRRQLRLGQPQPFEGTSGSRYGSTRLLQQSEHHKAYYRPFQSINTARIDKSSGGEEGTGEITLTAGQSFEIDLTTALMFETCCQGIKSRRRGGSFVLVNAWNDWAGGAVLEPSDKYGRAFLEAVGRAKSNSLEFGCSWRRYDHYINSTMGSATSSATAVASDSLTILNASGGGGMSSAGSVSAVSAMEPMPPQPIIVYKIGTKLLYLSITLVAV